MVINNCCSRPTTQIITLNMSLDHVNQPSPTGSVEHFSFANEEPESKCDTVAVEPKTQK